MNGNDALYALETGDFKIFYPNNNGREGLFINIQAVFIKFLSNKAWVLRLVSAIFGILTVWGLYLLTKELFGQNIAYLSSFFLAILFWHVNFSRIGFRGIMLPFILVFGFYFLLRALNAGYLKSFILAGVFWGLGFHTYSSYRVVPFIIAAVLLVHWFYLKKDLLVSGSERKKQQFFKGVAVMFSCTAVIFLPLLIYFMTNPGTFLNLNRLSYDPLVLRQEEPFRGLALSTIKTLGMFNFYGDHNWRHNISGSPQLFWPIGILFAVGFVKETVDWLRKKQSRFSASYVLVFSWFFIMLLPGFLSIPIEAPHALRTIGVIPVVMIFTAKGLWWIYEKLLKRYYRKRVLIHFSLIIFLLALSVIEFTRYFKVWAPNVDDYFAKAYADVAVQINLQPKDSQKRLFLKISKAWIPIKIPDDPEGRSLPVTAQTVMFLTDTFSYKKQVDKNVFYFIENER